MSVARKLNGTIRVQNALRRFERDNDLYPGTLDRWNDVGRPDVTFTWLRGLGQYDALEFEAHSFHPFKRYANVCTKCRKGAEVHAPEGGQ